MLSLTTAAIRTATKIFREPPLIKRWHDSSASTAERIVAERLIECWRKRLIDISWYMRVLNEYLARRANAEDECTGRFWEALPSMPRIQQHTSHRPVRRELKNLKPRVLLNTPPMLAFRDEGARQDPTLPMHFEDYLQLVDWTGRVTRSDKRGVIKTGLPSILVRLQIDPDAWQHTMRPGGNHFGRALGRLERLRSHARKLGQCWIRGFQAAQHLYCRT